MDTSEEQPQDLSTKRSAAGVGSSSAPVATATVRAVSTTGCEVLRSVLNEPPRALHSLVAALDVQQQQQQQPNKRRLYVDTVEPDQHCDKRRRNNDAAKKSRDKRRQNDTAIEAKLMRMQRENERLRQQLSQISTGGAAQAERAPAALVAQVPCSTGPQLTPSANSAFVPPHMDSGPRSLHEMAMQPVRLGQGNGETPVLDALLGHRVPWFMQLPVPAPNGGQPSQPHDGAANAVSSSSGAGRAEPGLVVQLDQCSSSHTSDDTSSPASSSASHYVSSDAHSNGSSQHSPQEADQQYRQRRKRNNEAAKKCRANRRALFEQRLSRARQLEVENEQLREESVRLSSQLAELKRLLQLKRPQLPVKAEPIPPATDDSDSSNNTSNSY